MVAQKEFVLVLFQFPTRSFITSCYVPKCIILTWSCFVPTWIIHIRLWFCCVATSDASLTCWALFTYYLANRQMESYLLNCIFKLKWQTIYNVYSIIQESWNIQASKCLTCTLVYTCWHCWYPGMFWNILALRDATLCYSFGYDATVSLYGLLKRECSKPQG